MLHLSVGIFSNVSFVNNSARHNGGALYVHTSIVVAEDVTVRDNVAQLTGGGLYCSRSFNFQDGSMERLRNVFNDFQKEYDEMYVPIHFSGSVFKGNTAAGNDGGAVYDGGAGGAVYVDEYTFVLTSSRLLRNTALLHGGAIRAVAHSNVTLLNTRCVCACVCVFYVICIISMYIGPI